MSCSLLCEAEIGYDMMTDMITDCIGPEWVSWNDHNLHYLTSKVRANLKTNRSIRQGFMSLWPHTATCLRVGKVPNKSNVLGAVADASEWPPATENYLERGGTVELAVSGLCGSAMDQDELAGDGEHQFIFGGEIAKFPECRNDAECGYVSGMCGYSRISQISNVSMMRLRPDEDGNPIDSLV